MSAENKLECDVLVIGGGMAGLFAAIKAREQKVKVILVDKGFAGRSGQTPLASGVMVFTPEWGHQLDEVMNYINHASEYLNNREWNEIILEESYPRYLDLVSWGVEFVKDADGQPARFIDSWGVTESLHMIDSAMYTGFSKQNNHAYLLRKHALKIGVKILDRIMVIDLLKQAGRIVGAVGITGESSDIFSIVAKTTILSVGACGFKPPAYPMLVQLTCDGEAMAYRAGAEILGKEFVDTHFHLADIPAKWSPLKLDDEFMTRMGIDPLLFKIPLFENIVDSQGNSIPARPQGVSGEKFAYFPLEFCAHAGKAPLYRRTLIGDLKMVGGATLGMSIRKGDGLWPVNTNCGSSLPGLYAAGDSLGNMQNGAVYAVGGGSITGCMVTGARAGVAAAKEAMHMEGLTVTETEINRAEQFVLAPLERKSGFSPRWMTQLLQNTMMPYFISYIKKEDRLQATLTLIEFFQENLVPKLFARDPHELRLAHEAKNMVLSAEMRLRSALFRTESRGNHYREDYPRRDDPAWLVWIKIRQEQGKMKLVKVPIPKGWWPDLSIPYNQRYPFRYPDESALLGKITK